MISRKNALVLLTIGFIGTVVFYFFDPNEGQWVEFIFILNILDAAFLGMLIGGAIGFALSFLFKRKD